MTVILVSPIASPLHACNPNLLSIEGALYISFIQYACVFVCECVYVCVCVCACVY